MAYKLEPDSKYVDKVASISLERINKCYQCGECTSGCPSAYLMDIKPNQVTMLLQVGDSKTLLESETPWLCLACYQCERRCPQGISIARILEAVRETVLRKGIDTTSLSDVKEIEEFPSVALVANFRKMTS